MMVPCWVVLSSEKQGQNEVRFLSRKGIFRVMIFGNSMKLNKIEGTDNKNNDVETFCK